LLNVGIKAIRVYESEQAWARAYRSTSLSAAGPGRSTSRAEQSSNVSCLSNNRSHSRLPGLRSSARGPRFLDADGREGVEGGGEEEGELGGGGRTPVLVQREHWAGGGAEGGRSGREGGEPVHGRQPGAPHRPRHRPPVSVLIPFSVRPISAEQSCG